MKTIKLEKLIKKELPKEQMNKIRGGESCVTCTPKGNHVDANDVEDDIVSIR